MNAKRSYGEKSGVAGCWSCASFSSGTAPPEAFCVARICAAGRLRQPPHAQPLLPGRRSTTDRDWVVLARAVQAHRTFVNGAPLQRAAYAAGYPDQFAMSQVIYRITGLRPSQLRDVCWQALLDVWTARQRERGTLTGLPPARPRVCPSCGGRRAS